MFRQHAAFFGNNHKRALAEFIGLLRHTSIELGFARAASTVLLIISLGTIRIGSAAQSGC